MEMDNRSGHYKVAASDAQRACDFLRQQIPSPMVFECIVYGFPQ